MRWHSPVCWRRMDSGCRWIWDPMGRGQIRQSPNCSRKYFLSADDHTNQLVLTYDSNDSTDSVNQSIQMNPFVISSEEYVLWNSSHLHPDLQLFEHGGDDDVLLCVVHLLFGWPDIAQIHVLPLCVHSYRFCLKVDADCACDRIRHHQRGWGQIIRPNAVTQTSF